MRQAGVLAAAARIALRDWKRLEADHELARFLARRIADLYPDAVDPARVETNMVLVSEVGLPFSLDRLVQAAADKGILLTVSAPGRLRLVTHRDVDEADADRLVRVVADLGRESGG
jgi:threonine aldolase